MSYTIANAKDDLEGIMGGTTVNEITNINSLFARAGRRVLSRINPAETLRRTYITLYDGVYDYTPPSDLKDKEVRDLKPQANRTSGDNFNQLSGEEFDLRKTNNTIQVVDIDGSKVLRVAKSLSPGAVTFATMNETTGWTADGVGLTDLSQDTLYYISGSASLKLNKASGQTSGTLTNSSLSSLDLTTYQNDAAAFLWVYLPSTPAAADLTSITVRWGSSASDYYEATASAPHNRSAFHAGWNLVRFDWPTSDTGTPDITAIDYLRLSVTTSTDAISAIRFDHFFFSLGKVYELEYYSDCIFRDTTGSWTTTIAANVADDTIINLGTTSYNIFLYEAALSAAQQQQGEKSAADRITFKEELFGTGSNPGLYAEYHQSNPDEAISSQSTYYSV